MQIKTGLSNVRSIKQDDPKFNIIDGIFSVPRAGFEISEECSPHFKTIIGKAIQMGWLKPVAYVKDSELFWEEFQR